MVALLALRAVAPRAAAQHLAVVNSDPPAERRQSSLSARTPTKATLFFPSLSWATLVEDKFVNARPHPGPLPQERENPLPFSGVNRGWFAGSVVKTERRAYGCSLSPGERVR